VDVPVLVARRGGGAAGAERGDDDLDTAAREQRARHVADVLLVLDRGAGQRRELVHVRLDQVEVGLDARSSAAPLVSRITLQPFGAARARRA
jgi:hypothetical protein